MKTKLHWAGRKNGTICPWPRAWDRMSHPLPALKGHGRRNQVVLMNLDPRRRFEELCDLIAIEQGGQEFLSSRVRVESTRSQPPPTSYFQTASKSHSAKLTDPILLFANLVSPQPNLAQPTREALERSCLQQQPNCQRPALQTLFTGTVAKVIQGMFREPICD